MTNQISIHEALAPIRRYEFQALEKLVNDMSVELRLLVSFAVNEGSNSVEISRLLELSDRYDRLSMEVLTETVNRLHLMKGAK